MSVVFAVLVINGKLTHCYLLTDFFIEATSLGPSLGLQVRSSFDDYILQDNTKNVH